MLCAKKVHGSRLFILKTESTQRRSTIHPMSARTINISFHQQETIDKFPFPEPKTGSQIRNALNSYGNGFEDIYIMNFKVVEELMQRQTSVEDWKSESLKSILPPDFQSSSLPDFVK